MEYVMQLLAAFAFGAGVAALLTGSGRLAFAVAVCIILAGIASLVMHIQSCPPGCSCALFSQAKPDRWIACPGERLKIERASP